MKLKVALFVTDSECLDNRIFDSSLHRDNCCYYWTCLRQYLSEKDMELQTYDVFERRRKRPDLYLFANFFRQSLESVLRRKIKRHQMLLWANETRISLNNVLPHRRFMWMFLDICPNFFPIVLTYDRRLTDGKRFRQLLLPQPFFTSHQEFWIREKPRFSAMIVGNKKSRTKGELYSLRQAVIHFFEHNHPDVFDLYGMGWNKPQSMWEKVFPSCVFRTSLYRGSCASKLEVLASYKFTFCPDNQRYPDYIDEKIFDALFAGSIPIYYGAPNISEYVPEDCFIDFGKFQNLKDLFAFMEEVALSNKLQQMRECGWEFLNGERFTPFRVETFCETIHKALVDLADKNY